MVIHSFYGLNNDYYFLSDYLDNNYIFKRCDIVSNLLHSTIKNNKIQILNEIIKVPVNDVTRYMPLTACSNCIYYKKIDFVFYQKLLCRKNQHNPSNLFVGICELRNNLFKNGCGELYVDCPFCLRKRNRKYSEIVSEPELNQFICSVHNIFIAQNNEISTCKHRETVHSDFWGLSPQQIIFLKDNTENNVDIYFTTHTAIRFALNILTEQEINENFPIYKLNVKDLNPSTYYEIFMYAEDRVIIAGNSAWAILWDEDTKQDFLFITE